jgi:SAM-dependent methyltransferase
MTVAKRTAVEPDSQDCCWRPTLGEALDPTTERLLSIAGVRPGDSVLEIHCGTAQVIEVAERFVGVTGQVTSVDLRCRQLSAGSWGTYDVVVCRHMVVGRRDPVEFLRWAAMLVRPGGILALHEMDVSRGMRASPPLRKLRLFNRMLRVALERDGVLVDAGGRLIDLFDEAGLVAPQLFSETIVGGADSGEALRLIVDLMRSVTPQLTPVERVLIELDGLEADLRSEARMLRSQIEFIPQVCAWTRVGQ